MCPGRVGGSSQVCGGSARGASAHTGLLFSIAKTLLALLLTPAKELMVVEGTTRCAAKGRSEAGNLGAASNRAPQRAGVQGKANPLLSTHADNTLPDQLLCQPPVTFNVLPT